MGTVAPSFVQMARPFVSCRSDRNFCISLLFVPLSGCVRSTGVTNASDDCPGTVRFTAGPVEVVRVVGDVVLVREVRRQRGLQAERRRLLDGAEDVLDEPLLVRHLGKLDEEVVPERRRRRQRRLGVVVRDLLHLEREADEARQLLGVLRRQLLRHREEIVDLRRAEDLTQGVDEVGDRRRLRMERAVLRARPARCRARPAARVV